MSSGQLARNRTLSLGSGHSSHGRAGVSADFSMASASPPRYFDPCAATASMFLYAQGTAVVCAHHDTLKIERVFARHTEDIELLAVDTVSERGAGRLVVSYDAGQTAIVWDLLTGDEIARFASYEHLSVAAWMRNGNVAFGKFFSRYFSKVHILRGPQETPKATLFSSSPRPPSIFPQEQLTKSPSPLWPRQQIVEPMQSG